VLADRDELFKELHAALTAGASPRTVVLYGMGGVGKSTIAAEYGHRHLAELEIAWQLSARDPAVLEAELAELAAQLGGRELVDHRNPVASLHAILAAYSARWLLIFDNAEEAAAILDFLPPAGAGEILITTQNQHWRAGTVLHVPPLDVDVAAAFLVSRSGDTDHDSAEALAEEMDGLPLALEQAAAYVAAARGTPAGSLAGYLGLYRQHRADLLARGGTPEHELDAAATVGLALSRLSGSDPTALGLLRLLGCLAPDPIHLELLLAGPGPDLPGDFGPLISDPLTAGDAVAALRRYSLLVPAGDGLVKVHRLVQAITLGEVDDTLSEQLHRAAKTLVRSAIPDSALPEKWPTWSVLLPHAELLLKDDLESQRRIARYLGLSGNYAAARDLFGSIAERLERTIGPDDLDTLGFRFDHAFWVREAGDPAGARDLFAGLASDFARLYGSDDRDALNARANLANCIGLAGDPARAREMFINLIPEISRIYGSDSSRAMGARGNLARWTGEAGDPAAAREMYAELLPMRQQLQGGLHWETLWTSANLARWTGEAGDTVAARDMCAELLGDYEIALGAEHPDTERVKADLRYWTHKADGAHQ
jgi:hypothetical protein